MSTVKVFTLLSVLMTIAPFLHAMQSYQAQAIIDQDSAKPRQRIPYPSSAQADSVIIDMSLQQESGQNKFMQWLHDNGVKHVSSHKVQHKNCCCGCLFGSLALCVVCTCHVYHGIAQRLERCLVAS